MSDKTILNIKLGETPLFRKGKVRNVFDLGDALLLVASDRISAFDCVMPNGIPDKGKILTQVSIFWFDFLKDVISNHLIATEVNKYPEQLHAYADVLEQRSMLGKKCKGIPVECVVRGYLSGSGWKDYKKTQSICGIKLPEGLVESQKLPEVIFTPTTKEESGHDLPITFEEVKKQIGEETAKFIREKSIEIYTKAHDYALSKGIIIADTKFEFGVDPNGKIILIDEVLTPDSSRFWPKEQYKIGQSQPSYDKQFVRDYLETLDWDKAPPAPSLPDKIIQKTREKYLEAYRKLTGKKEL